jgi:hypothetical protein
MLDIPSTRRGRRPAWARGLAALLGAGLTLATAATAAAATRVYPYPANAVPVGTRVKTATCGYPRYACKPGELGKTSSVEPNPVRQGRFVEAALTPWIQAYGADAVALQPAKPLAGTAIYPKDTPWGGGNGPGFGGNALPGQFFPSTGTWDVNIQGLQIPFLIPDWGVGVRSAMPLSAPKPITVPVPHGRYEVVWLLGTAIFGSQSASVTENYAGGSSQEVPVSYPDWCGGTTGTVPPVYLAIQTPYRLHPNGAVGTNFCGAFYAEYLPVNSGKTLVSLTFSNDTPNLFLMAMTLETPGGLAPLPLPASALPRIAVTAPSQVSFTMGPNASGNGIVQVEAGGATGDSEYTTGMVGGRPADIFATNTTVPKPTATTTSYLYFQVSTNSGFLSTSPKVLYLTVQYYDAPAGGLLTAQYDSSIASAPVNGAYAGVATVKTTGAKAWSSVTFKLTDVKFAQGENGGADFRLAGTRGLAVGQVILSTKAPAGVKILG